MIEKFLHDAAGANLSELMNLGPEQQARHKAFVGLTEADLALLVELAPVIERHADAVVDGFYANVQHYPELEQLIHGVGSNWERLKRTQRAYLLELFKGDLGPGYFERRLRVGVIHHKIGLTPRWYLGSYSVYMQLLAPIIFKHWRWQHGRALQAVLALDKVLSLDAQLAIDTYIHGLTSELNVVNLSKEELEQRLNAYNNLIDRVARGDLTARVDVAGEDILARLGGNLNEMTDRLAEMTSEVAESSNAMLVSVEQVRAAIGAQSSGAAQQAASVSETTATLEQIKATSQQNLEKATALKEVADRARAEGDQGVTVVEAAVQAMRQTRGQVEAIAGHIGVLNERLQQIGDITNAVGELASQSKMLALNASIEAAKAGDAGRGFAVVAEEVRDLAEQSRQATTQVQGILVEIRNAAARAVRAVEEGNEGADRGANLADRAGETLHGLNRVIHDTAMASQQIVAAVRQEAAGIDQIRVAMGDISQVTSQFVAATHQTEAATDQLTDYAALLQNMVKLFQVGGARFDFDRARTLHRTWVARLDAFLAGRESLTEEEAVSHHHCQLGRWYDGEGLQRYGHIPEMLALDAPHRELHELIHNVVQQQNRGQHPNAAQVMGRVRALSARIIELLDVIEGKSRAVDSHRGRAE
ncbi:MAG: protoglobin domain-containing protein [Pseudomonadota bacterium]|nr:protoglobin domain-containing protein [Pseudomonadota bacterium]